MAEMVGLRTRAARFSSSYWYFWKMFRLLINLYNTTRTIVPNLSSSPPIGPGIERGRREARQKDNQKIKKSINEGGICMEI
jgi:hypothetical protein